MVTSTRRPFEMAAARAPQDDPSRRPLRGLLRMRGFFLPLMLRSARRARLEARSTPLPLAAPLGRRRPVLQQHAARFELGTNAVGRGEVARLPSGVASREPLFDPCGIASA